MPQTRDDVSATSRGSALRRERIQADMNDALAKLKEMHEAQAAPFKDEIEMLSKGVQLWCESASRRACRRQAQDPTSPPAR
ncbi:MAG: host-nuclease inhibitor Gam family protein [Methylotetracoccus sp.]